MKTLTRFAVASLLAVSGSVMAEQELSIAQMDGVTAGAGSAGAIATGAAAGDLFAGVITGTLTSVTKTLFGSTSSSTAGSVAQSQTVILTGDARANATGTATVLAGNSSSVSKVDARSSTLLFSPPWTASSGAANTSTATGLGASASSTSVSTADMF